MNKISVIVPLYNTELYIEEAIVSLINQTVKIDQIIVVDDGSTDGGAEIVKKYPQIELIQKENEGLKKTLNCGLSYAKGDFIGFLDADDRWKKNKLKVQLDFLENHPEVDIAFVNSERFKMVKTETGKLLEERLDVMNGKTLPTGLYRKQVFEKVGMFSVENQFHNFMEWLDRAQFNKIKMEMISEVLYERRIHDSNMGIVEKESQRDQYLATLKASLDRRRQENRDGNE
jgi:glycosyltransferase involved in cell wall biosynthesis